MQNCLAVAALALAVGGSGCALPSIEGIFDNRDFAIFDDTPEARGGAANDQAMLVFLEADEATETLRTVSVDIRALSTQPLGEALEVGAGEIHDTLPSIDVVEGKLVRTPLPDGGNLITTDSNALRATSVEGSLTIEQNDDEALAGSFTVTLDDGGFLEGRFRSANQ